MRLYPVFCLILYIDQRDPAEGGGPTAHVVANPESSGLGNVNINIKTRDDSLPLVPEEVPLCDSTPPPPGAPLPLSPMLARYD